MYGRVHAARCKGQIRASEAVLEIERRAFSQWRTSWLSREGVMAVLTSIPAGLSALGWMLLRTLEAAAEHRRLAHGHRHARHGMAHRNDLEPVQ
jgi:hypothetical protein